MDRDPFIFLVFIWLIFLVLIIAAVGYNRGGLQFKPRRYISRRYGGEELDEQMEIDLRLTYKRSKELYPFSQITYEEYKKLQMERAFKRAYSSQRNKRMVR